MNKQELNWIKNNTKSHTDFMNEKLQNQDFQKEWLTVSIQDYIETGDYGEFQRALEQVIKARGTVKEFAQQVGINRSNLIDMLHGRTKTTPNFSTITKILKGLGYTLVVDELKMA